MRLQKIIILRELTSKLPKKIVKILEVLNEVGAVE